MKTNTLKKDLTLILGTLIFSGGILLLSVDTMFTSLLTTFIILIIGLNALVIGMYLLVEYAKLTFITNNEEIDLMAKNGVYAAYCPHSNFNLSSGMMPVRKFIDKGVNIGLGSDISGGHTLRMPDVIVGAIHQSKMNWLNNKDLKYTNIYKN